MPRQTQRRRRKVALHRAPAPQGLDVLAASIAHDFNNLLTVIRGCAEMLRADLPPHEEHREYVNDLIAATDRATSLTAQLQAFGQQQILRTEDVRIDEVVRGLAETLRRLIPEDVQLRVSVRPILSGARVDPAKLRQALTTLVMYAADRARRPGRVWLSLAEEERTTGDANLPASRYAVISVAKTGEGKAGQVATTSGRVAKGRHHGAADLRLASVVGFLKASGGYMESISEPGRGTMFRLCLPLVAAADAAGEIAVVRDASLNGAEVILVVEDDPVVRSTVRASLERYGYSVFEATDGASALRVSEILGGPVDLLITDLMMPELSGRELVEELRVEDRLPKVLLMSGYTDDRVLQQALPPERYAFLQKPFTPQALAGAVRRTLDS